MAETVEAVRSIPPEHPAGFGEIRIKLRADVLQGTEISMSMTDAGLKTVFIPPTPEIAQLIERNLPQLETHLAERIHSFKVSVSIKKGKTHEIA